MKYALAALAAAALAFLAAPIFMHEKALPAPPATGDLTKRFPLETELFRQPSAEDARWLEKRGHAFSVVERDGADPDEDPRWGRILAGRPKQRPLPSTCRGCHAAAGTDSAAKPLSCADCHDARSVELRLTRQTAAPSGTHAELRTALCAQCHHEYDLEWRHAETGARTVDPHHPQWDLWRESVHARSGASCADCHMPLLRRGAMRITDHRARTPLGMLETACARCHRADAAELRARVKVIQDRTQALASRASDALVAAIDAIHEAQASGGSSEAALKLQSESQRRLTFVAADRSKGFHAPQEAARLLGEAIDYARQAELAALAGRRPGRPERPPQAGGLRQKK